MALSMRFIQKRDLIGVQVLKGPEGLSHLEVTLGDGGGITYQESQEADVATKPQESVFAMTTESPLLSAGLASPYDLHWDKVVGQSLPDGWVTILWVSHNQAAGAEFSIPFVVDAALDDSGANILGSLLGPDPAYEHKSPSAAQAAERALLDQYIPLMGMSASDDLGRKHMSEYVPQAPLSSFGFPEGPIINNNLNFEEYSRLASVGLLMRGKGANSDKLFLTEAGRRSAGFPVA